MIDFGILHTFTSFFVGFGWTGDGFRLDLGSFFGSRFGDYFDLIT